MFLPQASATVAEGAEAEKRKQRKECIVYERAASSGLKNTEGRDKQTKVNVKFYKEKAKFINYLILMLTKNISTKIYIQKHFHIHSKAHTKNIYSNIVKENHLHRNE